MKKTMAALFFLGAMILGLAIGTSAASTPAETVNSVSIKIPFAFYAGEQLMPAGQYLVELPRMGGYAAGTMVKITSLDGSSCRHLFSMRISGVTTDTDYHLTFNKYGDSYFLAKVRNSDLGAELSRSRIEKKLANEQPKASGAVTSVDLVATFSKAK